MTAQSAGVRWLGLAVALGLAAGGVAEAHPGLSKELRRLDERLEKDPFDLDARLLRAEVQRRQGHLSDALSDVEIAHGQAPDRSEVLLSRALARLDLGCYGLAELDLDGLVDAGSPSWEVFAARARARERGERWGAARADYSAALALRPRPELFLARGRVDERRGDLEAAAAGYAEGLKVLGDAAVLTRALVRAELRLGRSERALAVIEPVLEQAAVKTDWLLLRAEAHEVGGHGDLAKRDRSEALTTAEQAMKRRPTPLSRLSLARALFAVGRKSEAETHMTRVRSEAPELLKGRP